MEFIFFDITHNDSNLVLGDIQGCNITVSLDSLVEKLGILGYADIIISGDFNSNVLLKNTLTRDMNVVLINRTMPTHFSTITNTLLDLFIVSKRVKVYDQFTA